MTAEPGTNPIAMKRALKLCIGLIALMAGLVQLRSVPSSWFGTMAAVCVILFGLESIYSSIMGRGVSPIGSVVPFEYRWPKSRYFVLEPHMDVERSLTSPASAESTETELPSNPYAPPLSLAQAEDQTQASLRQAVLELLAQRFLAGHPFIHQGVVIFLQTTEDTVIHAALPLLTPSPSLIQLNIQEALRAVPHFLSQFPQVVQAVHGRNLEVRMIASYEQLHDEVAERVRIPWSTLIE